MAHGEEPDVEALARLLAACRVESGKDFDLGRHDPAGPVPSGLDKAAGKRLLAASVLDLAALQERLYAHGTWSLLVVVQAQDAAGKDGTIKHVFSGVNPAGVSVVSFKAPGPESLAHDFLWRIAAALPARGAIGVFNRSHYEEVLVPRVHPEVLLAQRLPPGLADAPDFWDGRLADIAAFERHLGREGTRVVKFFLNVSRDEQKKRFLARLDEPDHLWKFDAGDIGERRHWDAYRHAYATAIAATATPEAPWFVIPADHKWLMRLLVAQAVVASLRDLDLGPVHPTPAAAEGFAAARRALNAER